MISINLLRRSASGKKAKSGGSGWIRIAVILVIGIGIVVGGIELMRWWISEPALRLSLVPEQKKEIGKTLPPDTTARKPAVVAAPAAVPESSRVAPAVAAESSKPKPVPAPVAVSSKTTPVAVPVAESSKTQPVAAPVAVNAKPAVVNPAAKPVKPVPVAAAPEPGMSKADSIRSQIAFANRVLSAFSYDLPPDVEFTALAIDSFKNVSAAGVVSSREGAEKFFAALSEKKFNLYPLPRTRIRPNGSQGFRFTIESSVAFGPDRDSLAAPVKAGDLRAAVAGFSDLFTRTGLSLQHPLALNVGVKGRYRVYTLSGSGAYSDFVAFVRDAYNRHIPCAFRSIRLQAGENGKVAINADVAFFSDN